MLLVAAQVAEALVDGIALDPLDALAQDAGDAPGHSRIEDHIVGEDADAVAPYQLALLECRIAPAQPKSLGLGRERDYAPVVVGQDAYRLALKPRVEDFFAGSEERIAVNERVHGQSLALWIM